MVCVHICMHTRARASTHAIYSSTYQMLVFLWVRMHKPVWCIWHVGMHDASTYTHVYMSLYDMHGICPYAPENVCMLCMLYAGTRLHVCMFYMFGRMQASAIKLQACLSVRTVRNASNKVRTLVYLFVCMYACIHVHFVFLCTCFLSFWATHFFESWHTYHRGLALWRLWHVSTKHQKKPYHGVITYRNWNLLFLHTCFWREQWTICGNGWLVAGVSHGIVQSLIQMVWDMAIEQAGEEDIGGRVYDALLVLAPNLRSMLTKPRQM